MNATIFEFEIVEPKAEKAELGSPILKCGGVKALYLRSHIEKAWQFGLGYRGRSVKGMPSPGLGMNSGRSETIHAGH